MAKLSIPEELDALIQQYLTDGILTDKERAVILRKAEGMGLDRDDIDLYLDAEVQKIANHSDNTIHRVKGKKCPHCGTLVPEFADKCPACGQFITPGNSNEVKEIVDNLEDALAQLKSGKDIVKSKAIFERYTRKARIFFGDNPKIQELLAEVEEEMVAVEKKEKRKKRSRNIISIFKAFFLAIIVIFLLLVGLLCILGMINGSDEAAPFLLALCLASFAGVFFIMRSILRKIIGK